MKRILILMALIVGVSAAQQVLKVEVNPDDFALVTDDAMKIDQVKQLVGPGTKVIMYDTGKEEIFIKVRDYKVVETMLESSGWDFEIKMPKDALLSIFNSNSKAYTFGALLSRGVIKISATDAGTNALIAAAASTGIAESGQKPTGNGFVLNEFGSPIGARSARHSLYSDVPDGLDIEITETSGLLTQTPGLIYDAVLKTIQKNLRLIFVQNPTLENPADVYEENTWITEKPVQDSSGFAYLVGVSAYKELSRSLAAQEFVVVE